MLDWKQIEKDFQSWLKQFAKRDIKFRNSYQAIVGAPSGSFRSDGMLANDDILLAIEFEVTQEHPGGNTGKYWYIYDKCKRYKKIILYQIFTHRESYYPDRKKLAEFYVEKMKKENVPIEYHQFDLSKDSRDHQEILDEIKKQISEKIDSEFGVETIVE